MKIPYIIKKLESKVNRAIFDFGLIKNGDSVMVGVSGGKDSYVLLDLLVSRRKCLPIDFDLHACHVEAEDMTYRADIGYIRQYCEHNGITYHHRKIEVNYNPNDRKPACFICSWKRRKMLFTTAKEVGCNKLALGHHLDDAIETLLMNMINHSQISSIPPKLVMFKGELQLIRPLALCLNSETKRYASAMQFPTEAERCRYDKNTHREASRNLIEQMERLNRDARQNLYRSMQNIYYEYIPKRK